MIRYKNTEKCARTARFVVKLRKQQKRAQIGLVFEVGWVGIWAVAV